VQETSSVDCKLKPPRTSSREGSSTLSQPISIERDKLVKWRYSLGEDTGQVNSTTDNGQLLEAINNGELGVVGQLEGTTDRLEGVGSDVGELGARDDSERLANLSQLGEIGRGEGVVDESSGAVDLLEDGEVHVTSVTEGDVVGPLELGERSVDTLSVGLDGEQVRDVGKGNINRLEVPVVVDVKGGSSNQVDTGERAQEGVRDKDGVGLCNSLGEGQTLQSRQGGPGDVANGHQLGEGEGRQNGQAVQSERSTDGLQAFSREGHEVRRTANFEVSSDLGQGRRNCNIGDSGSKGKRSVELAAGRQLAHVAVGVNRNVRTAA
jgi:hypothetical protein